MPSKTVSGPTPAESLGDPVSEDPGSGFAARPSRRRRRRMTFPTGLVSVLVGLALWQLAMKVFKPSELVIVAPLDVARRLLDSIQDGTLWPDLSISLQAFVLGYGLAVLAAIPLGLLIGSSAGLYEWTKLWIAGLYATPIIGLAPLFVISFGYGLQAKAAVVLSLAVFPILINTIAGARAVGKDFQELAVVYRANRWETFVKVLLPGSTPFIATGLRLSVGRGLIGVVVADLFGASAGLGLNLQRSAQAFDTANIYAVTMVLAALGIVLTSVIEVFEKRAYARSGI